MGCRKPEGHFFQKIGLRMGRVPNEILLVDDTLANVAAAENAGWKAAHWTGESSLPAILAGFSEHSAPSSPVDSAVPVGAVSRSEAFEHPVGKSSHSANDPISVV
ncbi:MAG: hypothetical protein EOS07_09720 [Mesorhizobium sp.]|uniref:HAD-IA family hydrolase n=1 Tax=Mesorhizobium TaxID=68287 RepID=UPI000FE2EE6D|nr:MAG: hypothetical protein EOQ56_18375 [Mesorhizobium sp.]RWO10297.1 MAG: hypothetical protein EOS07_09720 [Mesorhizobium sp.]RWO26318.1 MAG: hypothetical protein EOS08_15115 [Mesorhizobium sp.]RWO96373.1 MAG: hypothetical protein EOQ99_33085 [Mesorhizobium sp.]RWP08570.1 MAG: hypothetical protein EOR00_33050 [Mesorhizobium sp.]